MVVFGIFVCLIMIYYPTPGKRKIPNCTVQKIFNTIPPHKRLEFPRGGEVLYDKKIKEMNEAKLEFPEGLGVGVLGKLPSMWEIWKIIFCVVPVGTTHCIN